MRSIDNTRSARSSSLSTRDVRLQRSLTRPVSSLVREEHRALWQTPARIACFFIALFLLLPEGLYRAFVSGRDPNWQLVLHHAFARSAEEGSWLFGRDIVFTYGPLGVLYSRLQYPGIRELVVLWDALSYLGVAIALVLILRRMQRGAEFLGLLLASFCIGVYRQPLDASILSFFLSLFFSVDLLFRRRLTAAALAPLFAVICFYLKVSFGLIALSCLLGLQCYLLLTTSRSLRRLPFGALAWSLFLFTAATLALPVSLVPYLRNSLEFIQGFSAAMHKADPNNRYYLSMAVFTLASFGLGSLLACKSICSDVRKLLAVSCSAGFLFVLFKQGFVRADTHIRDFMQYAPLALGLFYPYVEQKTRSAFLLFGSSVLLFAFAVQEDRFSYEYPSKKLAYLGNYFSQMQLEVPPSSVPPELYPSKPLPADLIARIGGESVDVVTFQNYQLLRSDLNFAPRPVFHSYAAYTKRLDQLNADFFRSEQAPRYVLYSHVRIDDRYPFFDESITRRVLRQWYEPVYGAGGFLLLQRRSTPLSLNTLPHSVAVQELDERFRIPEVRRPLYLYGELQYTFLGKLLSFFYKAPPWYVEITLADGRIIRARAIPEQFKAGVLINYAINSLEDAQRFFAREEHLLQRITEVRFDASWPWAVEKTIPLRYEELSHAEQP